MVNIRVRAPRTPGVQVIVTATPSVPVPVPEGRSGRVAITVLSVFSGPDSGGRQEAVFVGDCIVMTNSSWIDRIELSPRGEESNFNCEPGTGAGRRR